MMLSLDAKAIIDELFQEIFIGVISAILNRISAEEEPPVLLAQIV